jgi:serine/threonine-protein kinase
MGERWEAELLLALSEGLLSRDEASQLRAEALQLGRSPLELLQERGRLSPETLALLQRQGTAEEQWTPPAAEAPNAPEAEGAFPAWDRYKKVRFLGEGGMGRVFLAYDPSLRREVALKFVRGDNPEFARRIVLEAQAQARVNHERVCKVYEVGEIAGQAFIAMQYVDGQPASALLSELTPEQKALILRDVALGVHEAHRAGLIHRDLKPSNIMVERGPEGTLKPYVMDFGLARQWNESHTATGSVLGTPHYMSPEQARGEVSRLDRRADVYSLGATLYHLLTGQPPVSGDNALEVLSRIPTEEPRPPRAVDPDLPEDLSAIVLKCLEKDRSARYDSARALAEDLERFLSGEPVRARAGRWYRLRKRLRKHRALVSVAAAALLLVALALGWLGVTRRAAALREQLARRFTEKVERLEAQARYSNLAPLHDISKDRQALRANMSAIEEEIRQGGESALGPGHYALGRGALALGDPQQAREYLESAWQHGYREPRVAYALALALGRLYQEQLLLLRRINSRPQRDARKQELTRHFREPALAYLRQSEGAEVPSLEYVAALLAFYEERYEDALARLDTLGDTLPWFYEAPALRGDILSARGWERWNGGNREGALADFEAGRRAYESAAAIARSVPAVYVSLGRLESSALSMELYGKGDVLPHFTRGLDAAAQALSVAPEDPEAWRLKAYFHRRLAEHRTNRGEDAEEELGKALEAARRAVELDPKQPVNRMELGLCLWQQARRLQDRNQDPREQLRQAVELFESIRAEDRDPDLHTLLGLVFKVWADYEDQVGGEALPYRGKAIQSYLTALQQDERLTDTWMNLGIAWLTRAQHRRAEDPEGDLRQATAALDKARALNPQHIVPYFYAGQAQWLEARRQRARGVDPRPTLARAVEAYRKGLEINPKIPQLHNGLGTVLIEQARAAWDRGEAPDPLLDQAKAAFEQAIAVAPQQGFGYHNVGEVLAWRARYQRAQGEDPSASVRAATASFQQALVTLQQHAPPWTSLGKVHALQAAYELEHGRDPRQSLARADEALANALKRNARSAEAWLSVAEARAVRARWGARQHSARPQDFEEAAQAYEEALELEPGGQDARVAFGHLCREWAAWLTATRADPAPALKRGLEQAETVLATHSNQAEARILRATLLLARAESSPPREARQAEVSKALEDFTQAFALNPHLERLWKGRATHARQLAASR